VPIDSRVEIRPTRPGRNALVIVDGVPTARLRCGEKVLLGHSRNPALFFRWGEFYTKVKERL
jgi:NAD kinase